MRSPTHGFRKLGCHRSHPVSVGVCRSECVCRLFLASSGGANSVLAIQDCCFKTYKTHVYVLYHPNKGTRADGTKKVHHGGSSLETTWLFRIKVYSCFFSSSAAAAASSSSLL